MGSSFDRRSRLIRVPNPRSAYVSVGDAWHRGYWAGRFGVSEEELLLAIASVGFSAAAIGAKLEKRKQAEPAARSATAFRPR